MGKVKGWLKQLRALFRKADVEREMDEEMAFHLRMETEENIRRGMAPAEARRVALVSFGGVERYRERVRDARWTRAVENLLVDLRHAARRLVRRPTFGLSVVVTLGVGLAALGTAYGIAYGVLLRPLPYPEGDRLVNVWQTVPGWPRFPVSWPAYERWRTRTSSFAGLAAYDDTEVVVTGGARPERVAAAPATANLAAVLGVEPARGRWFTDEEDAAGAPVVVVSHAFWTERLGGSPEVIGRILRLDDESYTIVGVMPEGAGLPGGRTALWVPLGPGARVRGWNSQFLEVVGRLAPGSSAATARDDVAAVTRRFVVEGSGPEVGSRVVRVRDDVVGDVRGTLLLALAAAAAVLLITVLNVANLFLARGVGAREQAAVRMALGAGRWRLARGLVLEGLLLSVCGAAAGLALASVAAGWLTRTLEGRVPRLAEVAVDPPVALAVVGVAALLGMLLGGVAARAAASGRASIGAVRTGAGRTAGRGARAFRAVMVGGQVAAVFVLLSGAGLLLRSLDRLMSVERGFDEARLMALVEPAPPESRYPDDEARLALLGRVADRLAAVPGVAGTALLAPLPFSGSERSVTLTPPGWEGTLDVGLTEATPGAFEVLGVPLLAGRGFEVADGPDAAVAVVGESLARVLRPDGRVVGTTLPLGGGATAEIVGVVGDVRQEGLADAPAPRVWVPFGRAPDDDASVVAATDEEPARLLTEVRAALVEVEPTLAAERLVPMNRLVRDAASFPRFRAALLLVLAVAAAALAAVGIYGVTSYAVLERRRELAIRSALGARGPRVVADALGRELGVVALGLLAGLPAALVAGRALRGFLHGVGPDDPRIHSLTALGILLVSAVAVLVPALRAVRADPVEALRVD